MSVNSKKTKQPRKLAKKTIPEKPSKKARGKAVKKEKPLPPKGPIPQAMVITLYGLVKKMRPGRGFSPSELKEAGLSLVKARSIGLEVDVRRKSKHSENVKKLKDYLPR